MPYSITTKDGITINNIPDNIEPDAQVLKDRVAQERAKLSGDASPVDPVDQQAPDFASERDLVASQLEQARASGDTLKIAPLLFEMQALETEQASSAAVDPNATDAPLTRNQGQATKLPELGDGGLLSGENQAKVAALAPVLLATTNTQEIADILESNFPNIGITQDAGGNLSAGNNKTGARVILNKPGLSKLDVLQGLGLIAAFTPAGRGASSTATGLTQLATRSAATQGGIEAAQAVSGGDVDVGDVALAGAIAPVGQVAVGKLFNYASPSRRQTELIKELTDNPRNPNFAKFTIENGSAVKTAALKNAVRQTGKPELVAVIKASSKKDQSATRDMLKIVDQGMKDPLFKDRVRVGEIIGKSLANRLSTLSDIIKQSGKEIDRVARTQLTGKTVNIAPAKAQFKQSLDDLRVNYDPSSGVVDFTGSAIEGSGGGQARDLVSLLAKRLTSDNIRATDAHFAKRLIDQKVSFGSSEGGLAGQVENSIKNLRRGINDSIREISPEYKKANLKYSNAISAIDNFQTSVGSKVNLESKEALGVAARGFTNNTQKRAKMIDSLTEIQDVLASNGVKFKDDILTQVNIGNGIEEFFETQGSTGLDKSIARGADMVRKGFVENSLDVGVDVIKSSVGITKEKALKSLLEITRP
jgi:hypothetical protein